MNVKSIIDIYPFIGDYIGHSYPFALGGYPSLVAQGILKESRESRDIDLCVFSTKQYLPSIIESISEVSSSKMWPWKRVLTQRGESNWLICKARDTARSLEYMELIGDADVDKQRENIRLNLGVDKSGSLMLELFSGKDEKPCNIKKGYDKELGDEVKETIWKGYTINYTSNTITSGTTSGWGWTNPEKILKTEEEIKAELEAKRIQEEKERDLLLNMRDKFAPRGAKEFFRLTKENGGKLELDLFVMNIDRFDKTIVNIDGVNYVNYYVVLKAKHEYCKNKNTNKLAFNKHINDLCESFNAVHIKGVNYPEDIKCLIENRK